MPSSCDQRWITIQWQSLAHRRLFLADVDLLPQPLGSRQKAQGPRHLHPSTWALALHPVMLVEMLRSIHTDGPWPFSTLFYLVSGHYTFACPWRLIFGLGGPCIAPVVVNQATWPVRPRDPVSLGSVFLLNRVPVRVCLDVQ